MQIFCGNNFMSRNDTGTCLYGEWIGTKTGYLLYW